MTELIAQYQMSQDPLIMKQLNVVEGTLTAYYERMSDVLDADLLAFPEN